MTLFDVRGNLPNGQPIKEGDVVKAQCGPYITFSKVSDNDGEFQIFGPGPYGFNVGLFHFISQGNSVKVVSPSEVYKFCKDHGWNSEKELMKFK
jgi:hypothetical protein